MSLETITTSQEAVIEPVTKSELLATWDRPRTDEELQAFQERREQAIGGIAMSDVELSL